MSEKEVQHKKLSSSSTRACGGYWLPAEGLYNVFAWISWGSNEPISPVCPGPSLQQFFIGMLFLQFPCNLQTCYMWYIAISTGPWILRKPSSRYQQLDFVLLIKPSHRPAKFQPILSSSYSAHSSSFWLRLLWGKTPWFSPCPQMQFSHRKKQLRLVRHDLSLVNPCCSQLCSYPLWEQKLHPWGYALKLSLGLRIEWWEGDARTFLLLFLNMLMTFSFFSHQKLPMFDTTSKN